MANFRMFEARELWGRSASQNFSKYNLKQELRKLSYLMLNVGGIRESPLQYMEEMRKSC